MSEILKRARLHGKYMPTFDKADPDAPDVRVMGKVVSYTAPMEWRA